MHHKPTLENLIKMGGKYTDNDQQTGYNNKADHSLQYVDTKTKITIKIFRSECIHLRIEDLKLS